MQGRRRAPAGSLALPAAGFGSIIRIAFAVAACAVVILDFGIIVLCPLLRQVAKPSPSPAEGCVVLAPRDGLIASTSGRPPAPVAELPTSSTEATRPATFTTASSVHPALSDNPEIRGSTAREERGVPQAWSSLASLDPSSLRLLPDAAKEASVRASPRWLFFGISSVHRQQAEYLGITLSHLFDALGGGRD
ncbi:unnamed protein product, partial [Polarella glacialis]